jgi:hypothetical protein
VEWAVVIACSHGATHAFVVVFRLSDVSAVPCVWGVTNAGREDFILWVERVVSVGVKDLLRGYEPGCILCSIYLQRTVGFLAVTLHHGGFGRARATANIA